MMAKSDNFSSFSSTWAQLTMGRECSPEIPLVPKAQLSALPKPYTSLPSSPNASVNVWPHDTCSRERKMLAYSIIVSNYFLFSRLVHMTLF